MHVHALGAASLPQRERSLFDGYAIERPGLSAVLEARQVGTLLLARSPLGAVWGLTHRAGYLFLAGNSQAMDAVKAVLDAAPDHLGRDDVIVIPSDHTWAGCVGDIIRCEVTQRTWFRWTSGPTAQCPPSPETNAVPIDSSNANRVAKDLRQDLYAPWGSEAEFLIGGFGYAVRDSTGSILSACIAYAIGDNCAEADVVTRQDARRAGLAFLVCRQFVQGCASRGLTPSWSCRTTNDASLALAARLGFTLPVPYVWMKYKKRSRQ